jgi:rod shape-determining protein MreC
MPLGTLDRTPPPFFRQGPSATTRLLFFASLAVFLMAADTRLGMVQPLRAALSVVLNPVERALLAPIAGLAAANDYLAGINAARTAVRQANEQQAEQAQRLLQVEALRHENERLRALLELRPQVTTPAAPAEVLYDAPDPYTRKVIIDRGGRASVLPGSPVIDERGVLGQVTRVYPLTAEVTLLTDRDAAIAVLNTRTRQRGVAYGDPASGGLELRFTAANADVQQGDLLATTGLDGVFPDGLPVAKVVQVSRRADSAFAKITLAPLAPLDGIRHVLVLSPLSEVLPQRPDPTPARNERALSRGAAAPVPGSASAAPAAPPPKP